MEMTAAVRQKRHRERRAAAGEVALSATVPAGIKAALKRLGAFYGGSEREMLARLIADAERETLVTLPGEEREGYFGVTG
jgi:hypothetical protein